MLRSKISDGAQGGELGWAVLDRIYMSNRIKGTWEKYLSVSPQILETKYRKYQNQNTTNLGNAHLTLLDVK